MPKPAVPGAGAHRHGAKASVIERYRPHSEPGSLPREVGRPWGPQGPRASSRLSRVPFGSS